MGFENESMARRAAVFCACLSVALMVAIGIEHYQLLQARQEIMRLELLNKNLTAQVNDVTMQWVELLKRGQLK